MDLNIIIPVVFAVVGGYVIYTMFDTRDQEVKDRLEKLGAMNKGDDEAAGHFREELEKPFFERIIMPVIRGAAKILQKRTSSDMMAQVQKKLAMAGYPGNMRPQEFVTLQVIIVVGMSLFAAFFSSRVLKAAPQDMMIHIICGLMIGIILPKLSLERRIRERQHLIQLGLPDMLDLLTVSVEAGLGFDAGVQKCTEKMQGPLAEEMKTILREIRIGKARKQALKDAAERIGVHDIDVFFSAIIQAEQLGVSLAKVLRVQSDQMRLKRRQRAEEMAQKAPIKMMFPLVLFIFPTIFLVLMGPAMLNAVRIFRSSGAGL